jgi:hypothetical protein
MIRPLADEGRDEGRESTTDTNSKSPRELQSEAPRPGNDQTFETAFTEAGGAAVAALLHLLRLMGAELVLMRPDGDPAPFEQAVRKKIEHFTSPTANEHARAAGLAHARYLVEQVMLQIRAQAELKRSLASTASQVPAASETSSAPSPSRLLN